MIQAFLAALLFGASAPLAKVLLGSVEPIPLAALLYLGSGLGALVLQLLRRLSAPATRSEARLQRRDLPWLAGAVLAGGVVAPIVLLFSLRQTPAATASLLLNFEGVATTLIATLAFREAIGRRVWGAVVAITLASILLSWDSSGQWGFSPGALGVIVACILWGVDNNLTRQISARDPLTIVLVKGLGAGSCSLSLALGLGLPFPGLTATIGALLLGSISYGASIMLFILALRRLGAARTGVLFGTAPFIGAVLSLALFQEPPTGFFLVSLPLMVAGAALLAGEEHVHPHTHGALEHDHRHRHDDGHHDHTHAPGEVPRSGWHSHSHQHASLTHEHPHTPDLHHRHVHQE